MRKRIAFFMVAIILCCRMRVYAEDPAEKISSASGNEIPEESSGMPIETDEVKETESERETEIPSDETGKQGAEKNIIGEQEEEPKELADEKIVSEQDKDVLYHVSFPTSTKAYLDPGNLSGKGQVFSDQYRVENYGNADIEIRLKNIDVAYRSRAEVYEFSDDEITDAEPGIKKMNINMVWKNEAEQKENVMHVSEGERNEVVLYLKAAVYDENGEFVSLSQGGTGAFYFSGTINPDPNLEWADGEITVGFDYEIISMEEKEQKSVSAGNLT